MPASLNPIYLLIPAVVCTAAIMVLTLQKKFWLWPTQRLMFPPEDLDPAFLVNTDIPNCDKAMVPIDAGNFSHLLLFQIAIYSISIVWANLLAGMIFFTAPSVSFLRSGRLDLQIYVHIFCLMVTMVASLFGFYKLQNGFFQKIASGKLPRNLYLTHLHFSCLIFIAALFWILPPVQCFLLQPLIVHTLPQFFLFIVSCQFISFIPLLTAFMTAKGYLSLSQNNFEDPFLYNRVIKILKEGDCSPDGLREHTDSDLLLMAKVSNLHEDFETSRIIEIILNERYEAKHLI